MTTRTDVAKLAGVSESTVSYVLSGKRPISEETRKRVLAAIEETGYKSNYAAAALAGGSPRLVTMMISNLFSEPTSPVIGELVSGVVDGVTEGGFHSVIWPISEDAASDVKLLLKSNFSGGVVLMNVVDNDERVRALKREKVPFVVLGRTEVGFKYNFVDRDFEERDRIALQKLSQLGHLNIGVVLYGNSLRPHLKKLAQELELKLIPMHSENSFESGREIARRLKSDHPFVTAVISNLDVATVGIVESSAEFGIRIPQDLSVIGLNILETQAEASSPKISTVNYQAYDLAKSCGRMIVEVIEGGKDDKKFRSELWVGDYVERDSVSKAKRRNAQ